MLHRAAGDRGDCVVGVHRRRDRDSCCGTGCCRRSSAGREITFWQALGLLALCRILFGGVGRGGSRSRYRRRMEQLTPEERERFRQRMRERFGFGPFTSESKGQ